MQKKVYLVMFTTTSDVVHIVKVEAKSFAGAEKKISVFPTIKEVLQITLYR